MKVLVVGNCQVTPLAKILSAHIPEVEIESHEVWKLSQQECAALDVGRFDIVISQPLLSARYGAIAYDRLVREGEARSVHFIHNLHFEGAVPDCTYLGRMGNRVHGPLSTYHSKIVAFCFRNGRSETDCASMVRRGAGLSPLTTWNNSVEELRKREEIVTIPFLDETVTAVRGRHSFHVFNHPTPFLLARYAEKIAAQAFQTRLCIDDSRLEDKLAYVGSWPTLDYVAEAMGLNYASETFMIPDDGLRAVSLDEFVSRCYAAYEQIDKSNLVI